MIEIRTYRSRKNIRAHVLRKYKAEKGNKYKQLGSFSLKKGYSAELLNLLDLDEQMHLENWLEENRFAERFNEAPEKLKKVIVRVPQVFYDTLPLIYLETKKSGEIFIPHRVMLEALLNTVKFLEGTFEKESGFKTGILDKSGFKET